MQHYIYKITNTINNKYDYGKRSCEGLAIDDNYMGSGKLIKQAQKKYGIENFTKLILAYAKDEQQAYEFEERLITQKEVDDPMCYNLKCGGKGACKNNKYMLNRKRTIATRKKLSITHTNKIHTINTRNKISAAQKGNTNGAKKIKQFTKEGIFIREWDSSAEAERQLNIKKGNVSACIRGKLKLAGCFKWTKI